MKTNYKFLIINLIILICIGTIAIVSVRTFYCLDLNNDSICDKVEAIAEKFDTNTSLTKSTVLVSKVIDGDTIELQNGIRVRLSSIDAPEKGEQYYKEATDRLKELVEGKTIILESDTRDKDEHCRPLRYVFVDDLFVNLQLIKEGYAITYIVKPNIKYETALVNAESEAETLKLNIWEYIVDENFCDNKSNL